MIIFDETAEIPEVLWDALASMTGEGFAFFCWHRVKYGANQRCRAEPSSACRVLWRERIRSGPFEVPRDEFWKPEDMEGL